MAIWFHLGHPARYIVRHCQVVFEVWKWVRNFTKNNIGPFAWSPLGFLAAWSHLGRAARYIVWHCQVAPPAGGEKIGKKFYQKHFKPICFELFFSLWAHWTVSVLSSVRWHHLVVVSKWVRNFTTFISQAPSLSVAKLGVEVNKQLKVNKQLTRPKVIFFHADQLCTVPVGPYL